MDKLLELIRNYNKDDVPALKRTVKMLIDKGVAKGVYQDYSMLADVIQMMYAIVDIVEEA